MTEIHPSTRLRPVIRVFVSSTFSDMKHERNALQERVYPKLEQLCQRSGFQFQAIDLRWGVSTEAGLDHRTMRICFDELRRAQQISSRPNFLILLGNRYGWQPLPEEISVEEFQVLERVASTVGEPAVAVLRKWYRQDENAVPPYFLLQSRLPHPPDWKGCTENAAWNGIQAVLWEVINRAMPPGALRRRFEGERLPSDPLPPIVRFQASATEQEIWEGALRVPDAKEHVLAFFRDVDNVSVFADPVQIRDFLDVEPSGGADTTLYAEQERLKAELRDRLGSANVLGGPPARLVTVRDREGRPVADVTTDHLPQLCADVERRLTEIIQGQIEAYWEGTRQASSERAARDLEIEQREHERFGRERGGEDSFVGRRSELNSILQYARSDSPWPMVVHGSSGCGKTALMGRAAEVVAKTGQPIVRFIGVTPRSSDPRGLLTSLCQELRLRHPREGDLPTEIRELTDEFHGHLQAADDKEQLILFLDALDQLADTDGGMLLHWLPVGPLPAHVKLVVSCLSDRAKDDPAGQPYAELRRRQLPTPQFINLDAFSEDEARTLLFERWLPQAGRTVSPDQRARINQGLASETSRQPIYLKLLFDEARLWRSYDATPELGNDVPALLDQLFERLSRPTNHGRLLVERVLGYLAASREGLAEDEILEILFRDPQYKAALDQATKDTRHEMPPNATRIPIAIWSRLRFDLAAYLTERAATGANVLTFYHRQVAEWVQAHFAKAPDQRWQPNQLLAEYFDRQDFFKESLEQQKDRAKRLPPTPRPADVRKVVELPYQRLHASIRSAEWEQLEALFTNLFFLEAKVEAGLAFDLAGEFTQVVTALPPQRHLHRILSLIEEALRRDVHFIDRHPTALFQCMWHTCWWYDCEESASHYDPPAGGWPPEGPPWANTAGKLSTLIECWREHKEKATPGFPWVRSIRPPQTGLGNSQRIVFQSRVGSVSCVTPSPDGMRIASGCSDHTVRVFDVTTGVELACLRGHEDTVTSLAYSPDGHHIISGSSDRTIRIWQAASGVEIAALCGHGDAVTCVAVSPDGRCIASGSAYYGDGSIRVWSIETREELVCFEQADPDLSIHSIAFSPDGKRIVSGAGHHYWTVRIWDVINKIGFLCMQGNGSGSCVASFSPDGRWIAAKTGDNKLMILHASTGSEISQIQDFQGGVSTVTISPEGQRIAGAMDDYSIRVWDATTRATILHLRGLEQSAGDLAFSADGRRLIFASGDIRLWDLSQNPDAYSLRNHTDTVSDFHFSKGGQLIVSAAQDSTTRIWNSKTGTLLACFSGDGELQTCVALSPDDRIVGAGSSDGMVRVWHLPDGAQKACLRGPTYTARDLAFSPDGRLLAVGGDDEKSSNTFPWIYIWDVKDWKLVHRLSVNEEHDVLGGIAFSQDGCWILSWSYGSIRVYSVLDGNCCFHIRRFVNFDNSVHSASLSPDGQRLLSVVFNKPIRVWDVASGTEIVQLPGHKYVHCAIFSPDGQQILSQSSDETRIWNVADAQCTRIIEGYCELESIASNQPWCALVRDTEIIFQSSVTGKSVAWFPASLNHRIENGIAGHPTKRTWAGPGGKHLYIVALEGLFTGEEGEMQG